MGLGRVARAVRGTAEEFPRGREGTARVRLSQLVDAANLDRAAGVGSGDRLDSSVGGVERPAGGVGGGDDAGVGRGFGLRSGLEDGRTERVHRPGNLRRGHGRGVRVVVALDGRRG